MKFCEICKISFTRADNLKRHNKKSHTTGNESIDIVNPQPSTSTNALNSLIKPSIKRKGEIIDSSSKSKKTKTKTKTFRRIMIQYIVKCVILILKKENMFHISEQININRALVFYINRIILKLLLQHLETEFNLLK